MPENTNELKKEKRPRKTTKKVEEKLDKKESMKEETKTKTATKTEKSSKVTQTTKPSKGTKPIKTTNTKKSTKSAITKLKSKTETKSKEKNKKATKVGNKSFQNKVIDNIKNFLSKIIEMQEKVKKDEEEEKKVKKREENEIKQDEATSNQLKHLLEYYDLPYRYNETVIKILAQTPRRLFVYWDVADKDKQTYVNAFGENFFNDSYPVLLVHNEDKNYTSEVVINDFANSWYINISDPRDKYTIQLGRKFKPHVKPQINLKIEETNISLNNDYLFIAISNKVEVPNDRILFEEFKPYVKYRNVKTQVEEIKQVKKTSYPNELKELYRKLYNDQDVVLDEYGRFDMLNPSSMGTSSSISK